VYVSACLYVRVLVVTGVVTNANTVLEYWATAQLWLFVCVSMCLSVCLDVCMFVSALLPDHSKSPVHYNAESFYNALL
jgi:hypothetical protein